MAKYETKNGCHPLLDDEERKCCKEPETPDDSHPHDCVEIWRMKLNAATNAFNIASAKAEKWTRACGDASGWEGKLKDWIANANAAHEKAVAVFSELKSFIRVVTRIEVNTSRTAEAIEAVLCLVKVIFDQLVELLRVSTCAEDPKGALQILKTYIECDEELDERKKQDALKCIEPYEKDVLEIYGLQEAVLKKLLEILELAEAVAAAIGSKAENSFALKWQLEDLRQRIIGETTSKAKTDRCTCSGQNENPTAVDPPCGKEISKPTVRLLPIRSMQVDNQKLPDSAYYVELKKLYEVAISDKINYCSKMNEAERESSKADAYRASLTDAISAAEAAENGKK